MKMKGSRRVVVLLVFLFSSFFGGSQSSKWLSKNNNPIELGKVSWERDYSLALSQSKKTGKPLFILFQEVPGCGTCQRYGHHVMSHPFIVEAIETHFVPLVIYNNKGGADKKILRKFNEPSWNNPVVRIIDSDENELVSRISGKYSVGSVLTGIINAMHKTGLTIPAYLSDFHTQVVSKNVLNEVNFGMYCFWSGEKNIGAIGGVFSTEAGFMNGGEVVKIKYDPNIIDLESLKKEADKTRNAERVFVSDPREYNLDNLEKSGRFRLDKESKYYLYNSKYSKIPMTEYQAMRINSVLGHGKNPMGLLSPRQQYLLNHLSSNKKNYNRDFKESWYSVLKEI